MGKRLTGKEIIEKAEKIKQDYKYMDTMPEDGWVWEFARRTKRYIDTFERLKDRDNEKAWDELFSVCSSLGLSAGVLMISDEDKHLFSKTGFPHYESTWEGVKGYVRSQNISRWRAITFKKDYGEAGDNWLWQQTCQIAKNVKSNIPHHLKYDPDFFAVESCNETQNGEEAIIEFFRRSLSCSYNFEDTIFIGISKNATGKDIKEMQNIIRDKLREMRGKEKQEIDKKSKRVRSKDWKLYIITYDLITKEKLSHDAIAKIFEAAKFEKNIKYDETNIQGYIKNAKILIESEEYKDVLFGSLDKEYKDVLFGS